MILSLNATIISAAGVIYGIRKRVILEEKSLDDEEKLTKISEMKEVVYKNVFFVLYVTYLITCSGACLPSTLQEQK